MKTLQYPCDHKSCQANNLIENTYRIFKYSSVVKVIRSLSFRIFVLTLIVLGIMHSDKIIVICQVVIISNCQVQCNHPK